MLRLLAAAVTLAAGIALGLAVTVMSLRGGPPFGAVRSGAWTAWPDAGTANADPYARAILARTGRLPLPTAVGLRFFARADDQGTPLDGRCDYALVGPIPPAQAWTVTMIGSPAAARDLREGFTSEEVIRNGDGQTTIVLARQARPGNWLPIQATGPFTLMLSLYDTPLGVSLQSGSPPPALPAIQRGSCS